MDCTGSYDRNPPIGRPMPGHQAFVLDERLRPVPPGVPGELCVAGPGVARGYLGRPDLTADRFADNPYADGPETERLYRTGDLVRWLPGGNLDFLGRTDRQLKVRGHRIEPGEVESVLTGHPSVQQAVVVAQPAAGGERMLAAYVTVEQVGSYASEVADAEGLRAYAAGRLPGYMVPVVVVLDELPLTPHGKVDTAALPQPTELSAEGGTAPRDAIEEQICRDILTPLLEWQNPDVEGDFFAWAAAPCRPPSSSPGSAPSSASTSPSPTSSAARPSPGSPNWSAPPRPRPPVNRTGCSRSSSRSRT